MPKKKVKLDVTEIDNFVFDPIFVYISVICLVILWSAVLFYVTGVFQYKFQSKLIKLI